MPIENKKICIIYNDSEFEKAQKWSHFFRSPVFPSKSFPTDQKNIPELNEFFFRLYLESGRCFVRDIENRRLEIDFDKNHLDYERRGHQGKNELIAKSLGYAKGHRKVLDLSVGMGIDSVFLTQLGFKVTGVERSPVLYALLSEAIARTQKKNLQNYELIYADALSFLKEKRNSFEFDAIYFDPMYPHKKKSALPKQEMVVFRDLVGNDDDANEVLREALTWPVGRVVVKRPIKAEPLAPHVTHSFEGKVVRYDSYVV